MILHSYILSHAKFCSKARKFNTNAITNCKNNKNWNDTAHFLNFLCYVAENKLPRYQHDDDKAKKPEPIRCRHIIGLKRFCQKRLEIIHKHFSISYFFP
jgi:hypothetical protein